MLAAVEPTSGRSSADAEHAGHAAARRRRHPAILARRLSLFLHEAAVLLEVRLDVRLGETIDVHKLPSGVARERDP